MKIRRKYGWKRDKTGLELLLVGTQAKVIMLEKIHGLNLGRATEDIDFAFAV